jgi:hypothetical protein
LLKEGEDNLIEHHIKFLKDIGMLGFQNNNNDIYRYILNGFDFIIDKCSKQEIITMVNQHKYEFVLRALAQEDGTATAFIPDYKQMLEKNGLKNQDTIDQIKDGFKNLLRRTLMAKTG